MFFSSKLTVQQEFSFFLSYLNWNRIINQCKELTAEEEQNSAREDSHNNSN